nr:unnamed protein product [Callosobruchus chinensis]
MTPQFRSGVAICCVCALSLFPIKEARLKIRRIKTKKVHKLFKAVVYVKHRKDKSVGHFVSRLSAILFRMGVVGKATRFTSTNSVKISDLADWIALYKAKKLNYRRKNLLIEAVLNKALTKAEMELRKKQQERRMRWQQIKSKIDCSFYRYPDSSGNDYNDDLRQESNNWDNEICEDLKNSLDEFMFQLKTINVHSLPIQRRHQLVPAKGDVPPFWFVNVVVYFFLCKH